MSNVFVECLGLICKGFVCVRLIVCLFVCLFGLRVADVAPRPGQIEIVSVSTGAITMASGLFKIIRLRGVHHLVVVAAISILAASTNPSAKEPEEEGNAAASQTDECQKRGSPLVAESVIHLLGEQNAAGTPETSDTGLGGKSRGGLVLVGVDQVVVRRVVKEDEAEADRPATESGSDPVEVRVRSPCKDEHSNGDAPAREHHGDQTDLRRRLAVVLGTHLEVVLIDQRRENCRHDDADSQRDEHEAGDTGRIAFAFLVHNGEGNEEHVKKTVENAHVQRNKQDDEFSEKQLEGTDHENLDSLAHASLVNVLFSNVALIASLLSKLLSAASKDGGCVCFGDGKGDDNVDAARKDKLDPVEPAPASSIRKETTNKGANYCLTLVR